MLPYPWDPPLQQSFEDRGTSAPKGRFICVHTSVYELRRAVVLLCDEK